MLRIKADVLNPERRTAAAASGWWVCDLKMARSIVRLLESFGTRAGWRRRFACGVWAGESPAPPCESRFTRIAHPRLPRLATAGPHSAFRCYQWMCYSDYGAQGAIPPKEVFTLQFYPGVAYGNCIFSSGPEGVGIGQPRRLQ